MRHYVETRAPDPDAPAVPRPRACSVTEDHPGRAIRQVLAHYGIRRTGPGLLPVDGEAGERAARPGPLRARHRRRPDGHGTLVHHHGGRAAAMAGGTGVLRAGVAHGGPAPVVRCVIADGPTRSAGFCLPPRLATCIGRPSPIYASNGCAAKPHRRAVPIRAIRSGRLAVAVAHLWFDCLRLAAIESVARRFTAPPPAPRSRPGKDYRAMVTQDLRRALRLFRLEPGFTAAAVLTLASASAPTPPSSRSPRRSCFGRFR